MNSLSVTSDQTTTLLCLKLKYKSTYIFKCVYLKNQPKSNCNQNNTNEKLQNPTFIFGPSNRRRVRLKQPTVKSNLQMWI